MPLERARELLKEPPRHPVLQGDDHGAVVEEQRQLLGDRADLMSLQRQEHEVLHTELGEVVRGMDGRRHAHHPVGFDECETVRADRGEVVAASQHADLLPGDRQSGSEQATDCSGTHDAHAHRAKLDQQVGKR